MSRSICLYLHVHQPYRVRPYTLVDAGNNHDYFLNEGIAEDTDNRAIFEKVAAKSYIPTNQMLLRLLKQHPKFKVSLSITGTVLEQMEAWGPEVLASFQALVATGRVELVGETYYHSLAFFYSLPEFERQVDIHAAKLKQLFGVKPKSFRNTELAYNNELAHWADRRGYKAILAEGWDPVLSWRSPNYVYRPPYTENIKLLMKNYRLSDDIAFRFSNQDWAHWPLSAETYLSWLNDLDPDQKLINLFMDYETFGEHQWAESGIFNFFEAMTSQFLSQRGNNFVTVVEAAKTFPAADLVDMPHTVTWADAERDLSAWTGNPMQRQAIDEIYRLEELVMSSDDLDLISDWRKLQASDHYYYMCTKWFSDGDIHAYFSPYKSPYDAFIFFFNSLRDLRYRAERAATQQPAKPVRRRLPQPISGKPVVHVKVSPA